MTEGWAVVVWALAGAGALVVVAVVGALALEMWKAWLGHVRLERARKAEAARTLMADARAWADARRAPGASDVERLLRDTREGR